MSLKLLFLKFMILCTKEAVFARQSYKFKFKLEIRPTIKIGERVNYSSARFFILENAGRTR